MRLGSPSLPSLSPPPTASGRGRGLADLHGADPMDRRLEQEKKQRYAQQLREQMESGSCSNQGSARPVESSWGTADRVSQVQEVMGQRIQMLHDEQQRMWQRIQAALGDQQAGAVEAAAEEAANRAVESAISRAMDGVLNGALASLRKECEALVKSSCGGVAGQLDDMQRDVDALRASSDGYAATLADHEARIRRLEEAQEDWLRDRAELMREQKALSDDMAHLQKEQKHMTDEMAHMQSHLEDVAKKASEIDKLASEQQTMSKEMSELQNMQGRLAADMAQLQSELRDVARKASEIDKVAAAQAECERHIADLQQEQNSVMDQLKRLRNGQDDLANQLSELPRIAQKLQRLEEEMPRLAAKAARDALERHRPPEPAPTPEPAKPPPVPTNVSPEAFAVLKSDTEVHELHGLKNTVGRAAGCDASITGSQAISNKHCSIDFDSEGRTSLQDMGSRNGTFLNERRVPEDGRGFLLQSGDAVQLGIDGPVYLFEYGPAAFAKWPRELQRASGSRPLASGIRDASGSPRGGRAASGDRGRGGDRHRHPSSSPAPGGRGVR